MLISKKTIRPIWIFLRQKKCIHEGNKITNSTDQKIDTM